MQRQAAEKEEALSSFPHSVGVFGDTNLDGVVNTADLSNVLSAMRRPQTGDSPQPIKPLHPPDDRFLYHQVSGPQRELGTSGPGWNSPPDRPWLDMGQHGFARTHIPYLEKQLGTGIYTGVCLSGLSGCQDAFTAVHGSRNHGFVTLGTVQAAMKPEYVSDILDYLEDLQNRKIKVIVYCGGADKPIDRNGGVIGPTLYETKGLEALRDAAAFANMTGSRVAFDALSAWPMKSHAETVLNVLDDCFDRPLTEGPAEHPDPFKLAQIMARCDEIGMCDDGPNGWLASSLHARMMLDPKRRVWKALRAPTCREFWMCNGHWSEQSRQDVEATARRWGITLIDQMRTV
jgi:hypothetical protein